MQHCSQIEVCGTVLESLQTAQWAVSTTAEYVIIQQAVIPRLEGLVRVGTVCLLSLDLTPQVRRDNATARDAAVSMAMHPRHAVC